MRSGLDGQHTIIVLRGEGNLTLQFEGLFQDARKIATWIRDGSNYTVVLDNVPLPPKELT